MTLFSAITTSCRKATSLLPLAYPPLIWVLARYRLDTWTLVIAGLAVVLHLDWKHRRVMAIQIGVLAAAGVIVCVASPGNLPRLYPLVIAISFLQLFLSPGEQPALERLTAMVRPSLSNDERWWLRQITPWWIAFLGMNTTVLAVLVFVGPVSWWAFYSGLLFYLLMFTGIGCSFVVGRIVIARRRNSVASVSEDAT